MPKVKVATCLGHQKVKADVDGLWAIHLTPMSVGSDPNKWSLTHVGCGFAFILAVPEHAARACLAEVRKSKLDWTLPEGPKSLTQKHKNEGRRLRAKYSMFQSETTA